MFCPNCGANLDEDELFCHNCGNAVRTETNEQAVSAHQNSPESTGLKKKSKTPLVIVITLLVVLLAVVVAVIVVRSNSPERRLQASLELGQRYLSELDYEQAIAAFEVAIAIDPKNVDAYQGLIDAYVGLEDADGVLDVYDLASDNLSGKDLRNVERAATEGLSSMIDDAMDDSDYERALEIVDNLSEIDEEASREYEERISDQPSSPGTATSSTADPGNVAPAHETSVAEQVKNNPDIIFMIETFLNTYMGNTMYVYMDSYSNTSDSLFETWMVRSFMWQYAVNPKMDSYRQELGQTQIQGDTITSKFTLDQLNTIVRSVSGMDISADIDTTYSYPRYENGYYIYERTMYENNSGYTCIDNISVDEIGNGKVVLYADYVVGDWNGFEYVAGKLSIELSPNSESVFGGYSLSKITYNRTDDYWKDALLSSVENGYDTIYENWNSVASLKNQNIWDHLGYYVDDLDGDGIPEIITFMDGPKDYNDRFGKNTIYRYNGQSVETSYDDYINQNYAGWTKYCYSDVLMVLSNGAYGMGMEKPNIYIYPDYFSQPTLSFNGHTVVETEVTLTINGGELTSSWPEASEEGRDYNWHVYASEDGTVYDEDGNEYSYLFWEGNSVWTPDFSEGFCVRGEDTAEFLRNVLGNMGLTPREYNEFIVYWAPRMQCNEYNLISFQGDVYDRTCPLNVIDADGNTPDNLLRVMMAWKAVDGYMTIKPQSFKPFNRDGFTVVEWGGRECK